MGQLAGTLVHSNKVLSTLVVEMICTDALEGVFWYSGAWTG